MAMKAREKEKLEALRSIKTALQLAKTEKGVGEELTEDEEMKVLQKQAKQRKESAEIYQQQKRDELYQQETFQAGIIAAYLPKPLCEKELENAVKEIIVETGAQSLKDMGKVMGKANQKFAGRADGKSIADKVKKLLS